MVQCTISSLGLGHATRCHAITSALLSHGHKVTVTTGSPLFLWQDLLNIYPLLLVVRRSSILDPAIVQQNALQIDIDRSWKLQGEYFDTHESIVQEEAEWIIKSKPDLVLLDNPPYAALASFKAGVRSVLVTNFTFDSILGGIAKEETHIDIVKFQTSCYKLTNGLIRLPAEIPIISYPISEGLLVNQDGSDSKRFFKQSPLVFRPFLKSRSEIRKHFDVSEDAKILFINFGGMSNPLDAATTPQLSDFLPDGWIAFTIYPPPTPDSRFIRIPSTTYMPDIVNAVDVVLGKNGYGICSEIMAFDKPLIYIKRPNFVEEEGLIRLIGKRGVEMTYEDFEMGKWSDKVLEAHSKEKNGVMKDGSGAVVELLVSYLNEV